MGNLGTPKEVFLQAIQTALGKSDRQPTDLHAPLTQTLQQLEEELFSLRQYLASNESDIVDKLKDTAASKGWQLHGASSEIAVSDYIYHLLDDRDGPGLIVRSDQDIFQQVPIDRPLIDKGIQIKVISQRSGLPQEQLRKHMMQADVGVTGVDYAIAETGSVVLIPKRGLSRLVSLVPPIHVAIVRPQEVVATLENIFLLQRIAYYRGELWHYVNFVSGPSRTADIEQTLVVGVHGPKQAHMILLESSDHRPRSQDFI